MFKGLIRGGLLFLLLVLVLVPIGETQPANAIGMQPGQVVTPWSAFPLTAPITSQSYSIAIGTQGVPAITWQVTTPSAPTSFTANLQASNDGTTYATIDSTTAVGIRTVFGTYKFIQFTVSATSGGSSPTITISTVYSRGNAISTTSGAIYGGGTFTGPLVLPIGAATTPSLTFTGDTDTGFYQNATGGVDLAFNGTRRFWFKETANLYMLGTDAAIIMGAGTDLVVTRDAANTLALRNGTAAQTFNIYNTYTDASNYERLSVLALGTNFQITTQASGTGTARALILASATGLVGVTATLYPTASDTRDVGIAGNEWRSFFLTRSIQGSKSKALTEGAETAVTQIAVPQTAGANFADAKINWAVYASDGTDSQVRKGSTYLAAVNKAGTETCTVGDIGTTVVAVSAGTLTCTSSCIVGLTDVVQFGLNCTSSLTQTTLNALVRLDMDQPNTVTPQ